MSLRDSKLVTPALAQREMLFGLRKRWEKDGREGFSAKNG